MIVSTDWLAEYVTLPKDLEELTDRLTLTGLNLEGVEKVAVSSGKRDTAIDLEVTSNRPDCLGHFGVAREIAVIWGHELKKPQLQTEPRTTVSGAASSKNDVAQVTSVTVDCPDLCPRYTARVIKGVKIGPSPDWLADRLRTLGIAVINNVVDITNYVMMEIGQPLHAFDFAKLRGAQSPGDTVVVRKAKPGEPFTAIDHKEYKLTGDEVVIADALRPVALGGVMGGADTEVSDATIDVLIEAADFDCMAVRSAARRHVLQSPSSYRFERGVDPESIDWASRRCCELILELAGGELCEGVVDVATPAKDRPEIKLRFDQIPRLLGVEIPKDETRKILTDLGCEETHFCEKCVKAVPPSWRADLTREADLLEEVARIHGYDKIPSTTGIGLVPSAKSREDVVLEKLRTVLAAAGFDEAFTLSAVEEETVGAFQPWGSRGEALATGTPVLRRANALRQSVVPSLLACRRTNETLSNPVIELYEVAKVYLPVEGKLPTEKRVLALCSGGGYLELKGVVEALVREVDPALSLGVEGAEHELLDPSRSAQLSVLGQSLGVLGELSPAGLGRFELRGAASVAELDLGVLAELARLTPTTTPLSPYPPVTRDLNVVVDLATRWADIERHTREAAGEPLESVEFQDDTYRDAGQIGEGKKSVVFRVQLRSADGTFKSEEADAVRDAIVERLGKELGATLRA
ncbi:Phenylalanine--tRNA ligase beta subunit [Pseudobythopirellula maris]|uniref:Phenylalanine--tRNA ligase beta subunit n=1 Tax=Pseudobythopirellula maris TaxID=2527991 RepID=A0A5C5ZWY7_9BACT|nr:phenylalanine--tRNA ligase subunit beta [Pseudobythopirellula maris]TWT90823.1 Phenylalanine--tRNA ligase beta subunit [Pseudobythopirellula maris]